MKSFGANLEKRLICKLYSKLSFEYGITSVLNNFKVKLSLYLLKLILSNNIDV